MTLRQPFLAALYDLLLNKLKSQKIQLPFRLFQIQIGRITQLGFDQCIENMKKIVIEEIINKYPGPVCLSGYSSGFVYAFEVLKKLNMDIKHFIGLAPVVNYSSKQS